MKKNFRVKKTVSLLLSSVPLTGLLLSACGRNFDFSGVKTLKIQLPFDAREGKGPQYPTFQKVVKRYNDWFRSKQPELERQGYLPVTTTAIDGYELNAKDLSTKLVTRDYASLPNLTFGYGSTVYDVARNNLAFDFNSVPRLREAYNPDFLTINQNIAQVDRNGLYLLPMGVSTNLMYVNRLVMNYLLEEALKQDGFTVKSEDAD